MIDKNKELGVQSYCFRGFKKNEDVIGCIKQCGLSKVELCAVHADFTDKGSWDVLIELYKNSGVEIPSIGVQLFKNDEATERKYFEFAKKAGARTIGATFSIDSIPASFRTAERLAEEFGINLAIHNHGGRDWLGSSAMLENVFAGTNERIGLCLDTAWALDSGEDPIRMVEQFAPRLYALHIKDFVFDGARKPMDVIVGTGNLDLTMLMSLLKKIDFNGHAVLEYEGDVDDPVPALKRCVDAIRGGKGR